MNRSPQPNLSTRKTRAKQNKACTKKLNWLRNKLATSKHSVIISHAISGILMFEYFNFDARQIFRTC